VLISKKINKSKKEKRSC